MDIADGGVIIIEKVNDVQFDEKISELSKILFNSVNNRNYLVASAILLMFIMIFLNKVIFPKLSKEEKYKPYIPLITLAMSLTTGIVTWILNPNINPAELLTTVFAATTMSSGSWELMMKPLFNIKNK